jgi:hypothetical protein
LKGHLSLTNKFTYVPLFLPIYLSSISFLIPILEFTKKTCGGGPNVVNIGRLKSVA